MENTLIVKLENKLKEIIDINKEIKIKEQEASEIKKEVSDTYLNDLKIALKKFRDAMPDTYMLRHLEQNELNALANFISNCLDLKNNKYFEIYYLGKNDYMFGKSEDKWKKFYINKKGFYEFRYSKKVKIGNHWIFNEYLKEHNLFKDILLNAFPDEHKEKLMKVFNYFEAINKLSIAYPNNITFSMNIPNKKVSVLFEDDENKQDILITEFKIDINQFLIEYLDESDLHNGTQSISAGSNTKIELLDNEKIVMLFSIKDEIIKFINEKLNNLDEDIKNYVECRKAFTEIINPYLLLNEL